MLFSRIALVALSVFGYVQAIPAPETNGLAARADNAEIAAVLNTLKASTDSILPRIDTLVANNQASDDNVNPLFDQLTTALTVATDALSTLGAGGLTDLAKRQGDDEIAATSAEIVKNINHTLSGHPFHPSLINAIAKLLFDLLFNLHKLLPGIIFTVIILLKDVVGVVVTLLLVLLKVLTR